MRVCYLPKGYDSLVVGPPVRLNRIDLTDQRDVFLLSTAAAKQTSPAIPHTKYSSFHRIFLRTESG
jgi:hypothetical protein